MTTFDPDHPDGSQRDPAATVRALLDAAGMHEGLGDLPGSLESLDRAVDAAGADDELALVARRQRVNVGAAVGSSDLAIWWHELRASAIARGDQDAEAEAIAHLLRIPGADVTGLTARAEELAGVGVPWALRCCGYRLLLEGHFAESMAVHQHAVELARVSGDLRLEATALDAVAHAMQYLSPDPRSVDLSRQAVVRARQVGDHALLARTRANLICTLTEHLCTDEAQRVLRDLAADIERFHTDGHLAARGVIFAQTAMAAGDLDDVFATAWRSVRNPAVSNPTERALFTALAVLATAYAGGPADRVRSVLDRALNDPAVTHYVSHVWELRRAGAILNDLAARCNTSTAAMLREAEDLHEPEALARLELTNRQFALWFGGLVDETASAQVRSICDSQPVLLPLTLAVLDESDALRASDPDEASERLAACIERWERAGRRHDAACARLSLAVRSCATPDQTARIRLREAADALRACGSMVLAQVADDWSERIFGRRSGGDLGLLSGLSVLETQLVRGSLAAMEVSAGDVMLEAGASSRSIFLVERGLVLLRRENQQGKELVVALVGPGMLFGESALLGKCSPTTAVAASDALVSVVDVDRVTDLQTRVPLLAQRMAAQLAQRAVRSERMSTDLAHQTVEQRLAALLLDLDGMIGRPRLDGTRVLHATLTQTQFAEMIGASRTPVTLLLNDLRRAGTIDMDRRQLVIKDAERLRVIAGSSEQDAPTGTG